MITIYQEKRNRINKKGTHLTSQTGYNVIQLGLGQHQLVDAGLFN